jgi:hypothetical protein
MSSLKKYNILWKVAIKFGKKLGGRNIMAEALSIKRSMSVPSYCHYYWFLFG